MKNQHEDKEQPSFDVVRTLLSILSDEGNSNSNGGNTAKMVDHDQLPQITQLLCLATLLSLSR
jgi:hypothetical protein